MPFACCRTSGERMCSMQHLASHLGPRTGDRPRGLSPGSVPKQEEEGHVQVFKKGFPEEHRGRRSCRYAGHWRRAVVDGRIRAAAMGAGEGRYAARAALEAI